MIVIDTPGLLSAPARLRHMNEQQRQLQQVRSRYYYHYMLAYGWRGWVTLKLNLYTLLLCFVQAAKEAEQLVLEKMKCQDYVILCVEVGTTTTTTTT